MARAQSQTTKMLDVTRSFVPVDPNAFPITLHSASGEDSPEKAKQVVPYEGYNFLPTSYGYKSYFGLTSKMDIDPLTSRVDYLVILQTSQFVNIAVALCENGIWTKRADSTGAWTQEIPLSIPEAGVHYDWSYCFIDNDFFAYRAGSPSYYRFSNLPRAYSQIEIEAALPTVIPADTMHPANQFYEQTPNFLNMEGQMGLFKAGSRLGFWDSANSIAWSSIDDFLDFTPAVLTAAGSSKFNEVQGRITNILAMGDGFVVYSTRSITSIARDDSGAMQWNPLVLMKDNGVAFKRECCTGQSTTIHYAYTTAGLVKIEGNRAEYIVPEIIDFLKESREPVFLTLLENRYLFLELLDSSYVNGLVEFKTNTIPASTITFPANPGPNIQSAAEIESIFSGFNPDLLAQINEYTQTNFSFTTQSYALNTSIDVSDSGIFLPLADGLPSFTQTVLDNTWQGLAVPTWGVNALAVGVGPTTPPPYYLPYNPYANSTVLKSWTINYALPSETPELLLGKPQFVFGTPDIAPAVPVTLPDTSLWGFAELYTYQTNLWATRDEELGAMLQYIGNYDSTSHLRSFGIGSSEIYDIGINLFFASNTTVGGPTGTRTIESPYCPNSLDIPVQFDKQLFTVNSGWTVPVVQVTNNVLKVSRVRTHVMSMYSRIEMKPKHSGVTNYIQADASIYGLGGNTMSLPNNPVQEGSITVINATVFDDLGNPYSVPVTLPAITPFVYQYQGSVTLPPTSFLLQNGSIGPVYPTIPGALVYDTQLQKWGKMKNNYKVLIDWSPLNNLSGNTIPYETFGMQGGILQPDGKIALFDKYPIDSYIKYGKIGYYRQGVTSAEEVRVVFRTPCTGKIITEVSLDNASIELGLGRQTDYTNAREVVHYPSTTGKWHTISLIGQYDILNVEFRGTKVGNR